MVSGFDNVHIRANVPRLEEAIKYGQSAGDRYVSALYAAKPSELTRLLAGYTPLLLRPTWSSHDSTYAITVSYHSTCLAIFSRLIVGQ